MLYTVLLTTLVAWSRLKQNDSEAQVSLMTTVDNCYSKAKLQRTKQDDQRNGNAPQANQSITDYD